MSWFSKIWGKIMGALDREIETLDLSNQITLNFNRREFDCRDGTSYPSEWIELRLKPLCASLEVIRKACGNRPITITSGYRTPEYNRKVGGAKLSQHVIGKAADFKVKDMDSREVAEIVRKLMKQGKIRKGGVGSYATWVHLDVRGHIVYWRK